MRSEEHTRFDPQFLEEMLRSLQRQIKVVEQPLPAGAHGGDEFQRAITPIAQQ